MTQIEKSNEEPEKGINEYQELNEIDFHWFLTILSSNFGIDYRGITQMKDKVTMLFQMLKQKKFTKTGLRKATMIFLERHKYREWTVGDFFACFPGADGLSPFIFKTKTREKHPSQYYRILEMSEARKILEDHYGKPAIEKVYADDENEDISESDIILENIRLRCRIAQLESNIKTLRRQLPLEIRDIQTPRRCTLDDIYDTVRGYFGLDIEVMNSKCRKLEILIPVHITAYFMRIAGYTLKAIGDYLDKDHSTIINSIKAVRDMLDTDPIKRNEIREIGKMIFGRLADEVKL
jgi:hypothetical protein